MQTTYVLKCWPLCFSAIIAETKCFEFRKNDRGFETGNKILLLEYIPEKKAYTGREAMVFIHSVWTELPGLPKGFCIMDIELIMGVKST